MIWNLLKYFGEHENWGNSDKMDHDLLYMMDRFRGELPSGCWIKVHAGFATTGHSENSQHYKGKAVDFHVVGCHVLEAESHLHKFLKSHKIYDVVGLGIYPDWNNPGFHIDNRGKYARWGYIGKDSISYNEALNQIRIKNGHTIVKHTQ